MDYILKNVCYVPPRTPERVSIKYHYKDDIGEYSHTIYLDPDSVQELPKHERLISYGSLLLELVNYVSKECKWEDNGYWIKYSEVEKIINSLEPIIETTTEEN